MENFNNAIDRIKHLECPTGQLEERITGIFVDYNVAKRNQIIVSRNEQLDTAQGEAYTAYISGGNESIVLYAKAGLDDYVVKVVDVSID